MSTTMIIKPGPLVDFLIENQGVRDPYGIDWAKVDMSVNLFLIMQVYHLFLMTFSPSFIG